MVNGILFAPPPPPRVCKSLKIIFTQKQSRSVGTSTTDFSISESNLFWGNFADDDSCNCRGPDYIADMGVGCNNRVRRDEEGMGVKANAREREI